MRNDTIFYHFLRQRIKNGCLNNLYAVKGTGHLKGTGQIMERRPLLLI